jgi:hypothetical protein
MTYVIGINYPYLKLSAIICDTKFTAGDQIEGREAPALKSGLLFDGCIFGASGEVDHIVRFVTDCKTNFGNINSAETAFWKFENALPEYDFWGYDDFQLVLSTNHGGEPSLYLLDPKAAERLIPIELGQGGNFVSCSIGSGKPLLDLPFFEYLEDKGKIGLSQDPEDLVYGWCAWLMQYARGDKALELEKVGVGGYFHFWVQTATETKPQKTRLYVLFAIFSGVIHGYCYRVGYLHNGDVLVLNDMSEGDRHIVKNFWNINDSDDVLESITGNIKPQRRGEFHYSVSSYNNYSVTIREMGKQFDLSTPYYFCSVGFAHPAHQFRVNHINKNNAKHWFEGDAPSSMSEELVRDLFGVYAAINPIDGGISSSKLWKKFTVGLDRYLGLKFRKDIKYPELTIIDDDPSQKYAQTKRSLQTKLEGKLGHPVQEGFVQIGRGFVHTSRGRRDFVFPPLPDGLPPLIYRGIVKKFAKEHFVALGMACVITIDDDGVMYSCPTREIRPHGFGRKIEEWGNPDFFEKTRAAFVEHVNRKLAKMGRSGYYEI